MQHPALISFCAIMQRSGEEITRCAHKGRVPVIHVRYTPFFCVYCVPYNWSQVHKYTNIMDYVEMYDKNYGVQIVELE